MQKRGEGGTMHIYGVMEKLKIGGEKREERRNKRKR